MSMMSRRVKAMFESSIAFLCIYQNVIVFMVLSCLFDTHVHLELLVIPSDANPNLLWGLPTMYV